MKQIDGKVAAVTGAGSGIGRALTLELTRRECRVAASDIDEAALAETAELAETAGTGRVTPTRVDVADRGAVERWAADTADCYGAVNLVVNNAGVALNGNVGEMSETDFRWLMEINFWGVVHGTTAFLPFLRATGDAHIVNVSSVFGLMGIPSQAAYNSAKFGVRGFTEALRIELDMEKCGVSATSIHPGGIDTNIVRNARLRDDTGGDVTAEERDEMASSFRGAARTSSDDAARSILRAVEKNKRRAMVGRDAHVFDLVTRLSPRFSQLLMARLAARQPDGII